jgi:hypothetical protein
MLSTMPLGWIRGEEAEKLAVELGVSVQGTLDDVRKKLKEKWKALEQYLPPQSTDKSVVMHAAGFSNDSSRGDEVHDHVTYSQCKLKGKVVADLVRNVPVLSTAKSERVFEFLVRANEIHDLKLVSNGEFLALLVARTAGRFTQIVSADLGTLASWGWFAPRFYPHSFLLVFARGFCQSMYLIAFKMRRRICPISLCR